MPCASPDLKQAGACGRRPGQVSRGEGFLLQAQLEQSPWKRQPIKLVLALKKVARQLFAAHSYLSLAPTAAKPLKRLPTKLVFAPSLFRLFYLVFLTPQPYQIRLVMPFIKPTRVVLAPSLSRLCCLVFFLPPTVSDTVGGGDSSLWPQGTVTELPSGTSPGPPPKSRIPKSKLFWPDFGDFGSLCSNSSCEAPVVQILDFGAGFWILERYVAFL